MERHKRAFRRPHFLQTQWPHERKQVRIPSFWIHAIRRLYSSIYESESVSGSATVLAEQQLTEMLHRKVTSSRVPARLAGGQKGWQRLDSFVNRRSETLG